MYSAPTCTLVALLRLVCKDVFELAAVDEASLDVAGGVGEAHGLSLIHI